MRRSELSQHVTGRPTSMFAPDMVAQLPALRSALGGARVVVVGAAGSIGAATVRVLARFPLRRLVLCDVNENGLVELLRDLRSQREPIAAEVVRVAPLDAGAPAMATLVRDEPVPDFVLNFAASKHVRAERDVPSLLHLLKTNVLLQTRLQHWFGGPATRRFSVSTDKAANPVSLMGASKRLMEHVLFGQGAEAALAVTARFANVAFSAGSLLESWTYRYEKGQAMAVPRGVRRYFVSEAEAGELCTLAAVLGPGGHVLVPVLNPTIDMRPMVDVLGDVLAAWGRSPRLVPDEAAARIAEPTMYDWPVLVTDPDTPGEKSYEEFVGAGERAEPTVFAALQAIRPTAVPTDLLSAIVRQVEAWCANPPATLSKADIVECLGAAVPELRHIESARSLDDRM